MLKDGLEVPEVGHLVEVRGQQWVVSGIVCSSQLVDGQIASPPPGRTLIRFTSVSDDDMGDALTVVRPVESDRAFVPAIKLPESARQEH